MNDINFDELDQAVNTAMKTTGATPPPEPEQQQPVQPSEPVPDSSEDSTSSVVSDAPSASESADTSRPAVVSQPHRGQFMDMVHPSSDMTAKNSEASLLRRKPPTVAPLSPAIMEADATAPVVDSMLVRPVSRGESQTQSASLEDTPPTSPEPVMGTHEAVQAVEREWPDPLDLAEDTSAEPESVPSSAEIVAENPPVPYNEPKDDMVDTPEQATDLSEPEDMATDDYQESTIAPEPPHESPFIDSVDVEKRPLGAFTGPHEEVHDGYIETGTPESISEPSSNTDTEGGAEESVQYETSDTIDTEMTETTSAPQVDDAASAEAPALSTVPATEPETSGATGVLPATPDTASSVDSEEHPVFDTEQYHQPLMPVQSKKQSHVVMYILLAVLMVVIGAGLGYALFVLKLI